MRLFRATILLAVALSIPFVVWGDIFTQWFTGDSAVRWIRAQGAWGGMATVGLLISDLFLPVPSTAVMSAAGFIYGWALGGLIGAAGSFLSGMLAYGLSRAFGRAWAHRVAEPVEIEKSRALFDARGPWLIVLSRWLPLLPEVSCCLAGLAGMRFSTFVTALACGSLPVGFCFAIIGHAGQERPVLALVLSALVPVGLWLIVRMMFRSGPRG